MMNGLLAHLKLTDEQRVAVNHWKYVQRLANDVTGPKKGYMSEDLVRMWNKAVKGVFAVGLDPQDDVRTKK